MELYLCIGGKTIRAEIIFSLLHLVKLTDLDVALINECFKKIVFHLLKEFLVAKVTQQRCLKKLK